MAIERDETSDCTNPKIDVTCRINGVLTDPYSLEYIIYERVTSAPALVQVYPPTGRATVDLNDCPVGHRIGSGNFVAEWTVPSAEPIGIHEIHWFYKESVAHPEKTEAFEFAVTLPASLTPDDLYVSVQDIRDEGITVSELSDDRALALTTGWQAWFDSMTGQWFNRKELTLQFDGNGSRVLWLPVPIIELTALYINDDFNNPVDTSYYTVYNRYYPEDDRKNPRIKMKRRTSDDIFSAVSDYKFNVGDLNQQLVGAFGYVDQDGSTPHLVKRAIMQLIIATMEIYADGDLDAMRSGRVIEEVTDRHRIEYANLYDDIMAWNPTGLSDVDLALRMYRRPATIETPRTFVSV